MAGAQRRVDGPRRDHLLRACPAAVAYAGRVLNSYANSWVEAQPIAGALRVARGETLYRDHRTSDAATPLTYGVLEYAVPGWVGRATGKTTAIDLAHFGRGISLFAEVGIFFLAASLARRQGAHAPWYWLAAIPLLWFPYPFEWFHKFAPDAPALLFSLAGWWVVGGPQRWGFEQPERGAAAWRSPATLARSAAAVFFWTIAFHFKPNVLVGLVGFAAEFLLFARSGAGSAGVEGSLRASHRLPLGLSAQQGRALSVVAALGLATLACTLVSAFAIDRATDGLWRLNLIDAMLVCEVDLRFVLGDLRLLQPEGAMLLLWMAVVAAILFRRSLPRLAARKSWRGGFQLQSAGAPATGVSSGHRQSPGPAQPADVPRADRLGVAGRIPFGLRRAMALALGAARDRVVRIAVADHFAIDDPLLLRLCPQKPPQLTRFPP